MLFFGEASKDRAAIAYLSNYSDDTWLSSSSDCKFPSLSGLLASVFSLSDYVLATLLLLFEEREAKLEPCRLSYGLKFRWCM